MALVECPECGEKVSDKATRCPHCGFPLDSHQEGHKEQAAPEGKAAEEKAKDTSDKVAKRPPFVMIGVIVVAVIAVIVAASSMNKPKYTGFASEVARQVGPVDVLDQASKKPIVEITVSTILDVDPGEDVLTVQDPITGKVQNVSLKKPTSRKLSGMFRARGKVFHCDGISSISIVDAEIVSGG